MALNPGEVRSGGGVYDAEGRRVYKLIAGGAALAAGEIRSGGRVVDADGREVISAEAASIDPALHSALAPIASGEETVPRVLAGGSAAITLGRLTLSYFTAYRTETILTVRTVVRATAAATPTLNRIGMYTVAANGDLDLVASTPNDTAMWIATFTGYTKTFSAPFAKVAGQRYAMGVLSTGATAPALYGAAGPEALGVGLAPRIQGDLAGQTDLPASVPNASVTTLTGALVYGLLRP